MPKFTDLYIRNLEPRKTRYEVREEGREGFAVRVSPSGVKSFVFCYRHDGRRHRLTLGDRPYPALSLAAAHKLYAEALGSLARGLNPALEKQRARKAERVAREEEAREPTVAFLTERYLVLYARPRKRSASKDEQMLNKDVLPAWGGRKVKSITRADVLALLDAIQARGATVHANRMLALVRKMFKFGLDRGYVDSNPCAGVTKPAVEKPRHRVLSEAEIRTFWTKIDDAPMDDRIRRILRVTLLTGQRPGEVAGMRWEEIDGDLWVIPAERHKSKRPRAVPLATPTQGLLGTRREAGPVFPCRTIAKTGESVRAFSVAKALKRCLGDLGIEPFTPHDLRRTAATQWSHVGVQRHMKPFLLGHVLAGVTDRHYDLHEYLPEKTRALARWAEWVQCVAEGREPRGAEVIVLSG